jgi:hypothetical protein
LTNVSVVKHVIYFGTEGVLFILTFDFHLSTLNLPPSFSSVTIFPPN